MSHYFNFNFKLSFLLLLFLSLNVTKVIECSSTDPMDAIPFLNLPRDHFRSSWGSFWGRDHFRSSWGSFRVQLGGIISGLGIILGLGIISGPVWDHFRAGDHFRACTDMHLLHRTLFLFSNQDFDYSRRGNPNRSCFEACVAALDEAKHCKFRCQTNVLLASRH